MPHCALCCWSPHTVLCARLWTPATQPPARHRPPKAPELACCPSTPSTQPQSSCLTHTLCTGAHSGTAERRQVTEHARKVGSCASQGVMLLKLSHSTWVKLLDLQQHNPQQGAGRQVFLDWSNTAHSKGTEHKASGATECAHHSHLARLFTQCAGDTQALQGSRGARSTQQAIGGPRDFLKAMILVLRHPALKGSSATPATQPATRYRPQGARWLLDHHPLTTPHTTMQPSNHAATWWHVPCWASCPWCPNIPL
jgi:hypothetical protein